MRTRRHPAGTASTASTSTRQRVYFRHGNYVVLAASSLFVAVHLATGKRSRQMPLGSAINECKRLGDGELDSEARTGQVIICDASSQCVTLSSRDLRPLAGSAAMIRFADDLRRQYLAERLDVLSAPDRAQRLALLRAVNYFDQASWWISVYDKDRQTATKLLALKLSEYAA